MFLLYKLAGSMIVPPGLFIIILLLLAAVAWRKPRRKGLAFSLCLFAFILCVMSTSAGALLITGPLETLYKAKLPPQNADAAILVLAGGSSYDDKGSSVQPGVYAMERVYAAVQLAKERPGHSTLILSGGNVFGANDRSEAAALRDAARAMGWEKECAARGIPGRLIPLPSEITAGCGLGWRMLPEDWQACQSQLNNAGYDAATPVEQ